MSGGGDRTEKPTDKRIRDELKRGNVAQSKEVLTFTAILATAALVSIIMPASAPELMKAMLPFVDSPEDIPAATFADVSALALWAAKAVGTAFFAFAATAFFLGLAGALAQGRFVFAKERIRPKLNKISPLAGMKRLASLSNLIEFAKGVAKVAAVSGITAAVLVPHYRSAERMVGLPPQSILPAAGDLGGYLLVGMLVFAAVVAVLDRIYRRFEWQKRIMMTKQEVKEEFKQNDGDPAIKAKRRDRARIMSKQRMISKVPTATFVVTNPTHYAVALRYIPGETAAPVCVAKGLDNVALKIRQIADSKDIPVIENPPLARALHASTDLEKAIPEEHFEAVARVVTFVMSLKGKGGYHRMPGTA